MHATEHSPRAVDSLLPPIWQTVTPYYDIVRKQGEGSFGSVVLAQSKSTGQLVAIKLISDVLSDETHCK